MTKFRLEGIGKQEEITEFHLKQGSNDTIHLFGTNIKTQTSKHILTISSNGIRFPGNVGGIGIRTVPDENDRPFIIDLDTNI